MSKKLPDGKLWLPTSKLPVVETLLAAFDERAAIVFVGEPGVGKTCVLRALRHRIPSAGFRLTYCHNATLGQSLQQTGGDRRTHVVTDRARRSAELDDRLVDRAGPGQGSRRSEVERARNTNVTTRSHRHRSA